MQTPEEVYQALAREGYRVDYYRVPLTDGTAPKVGPAAKALGSRADSQGFGCPCKARSRFLIPRVRV